MAHNRFRKDGVLRRLLRVWDCGDRRMKLASCVQDPRRYVAQFDVEVGWELCVVSPVLGRRIFVKAEQQSRRLRRAVETGQRRVPTPLPLVDGEKGGNDNNSPLRFA